jgi:imidazolonepropionase-like amidohydrolase
VNRILLRRGNLLDCETGTVREGVDVLVEGNRIREVSDRAVHAADALVLDARGRTLMPGLIDAHVHVMGVTLDVNALGRMPPYLVAAKAGGVLRSMLMRGFTSVRDAGGAEWGLAEAVRQGDFTGPRLFVSGLALAHTGGQGDFRARGERELGCPVCRGERSLTRIVDGVEEVRKATRQELRDGADQIKVMASGGMASGVPIERVQFSIDELEVMVEEAGRCGTYVMAHAYESEAIRRCLQAGVRSIEHGSAVDAPTATMMAERGAFLVPTLSVYSTLNEFGANLGFAPAKVDAFGRILRDAFESLERVYAAGVQIGHGSDLEGQMHCHQSREFRLKAEVLPLIEVVKGATITSAKLLNRKGELGVIAENALADILVVDGDPTTNIDALANPDKHIKLIMKDGIVYKNDL